MTKTIDIALTIPTATTKLKNSDGSFAEFIFKPLKQNELLKIQTDLDRVKAYTPAELESDPAKAKEGTAVLRAYKTLGLSHLIEIVGDVYDFGEKVTLEQIRSGDVSIQLINTVEDLYQRLRTETGAKDVEEVKKDSEGSASVPA